MKLLRRLFAQIKMDYEQIEPACPFADECGGCQLQRYRIEDQRDMKLRVARYVITENIGDEYSSMVRSVIRVGPEYGYRTRMDFVTAFDRIGLRKRKDYRTVIDIDHCLLMSDRMNNVLKEARSTLEALRRDNGLTFYDYLNHKGYLRYLSIRSGIDREGREETMIIFTTKTSDPFPLHAFRSVESDSVYQVVNSGLFDTAGGTPVSFIGKPFIRHTINLNRSVTYLIGPNTFFQTNRFVTKVYADLIAETHGYDSVVDLYSGTGAITLLLENPNVIGVELIKENVDMANRNLEINKDQINNNIEFVVEDVRQYLTHGDNADLVIVDPPRSGLGKKVAKLLGQLAPQRIVYMSCNMVTQTADAAVLKEYGYEPVKINVYDLFPLTYHMESLMVLDITK